MPSVQLRAVRRVRRQLDFINHLQRDNEMLFSVRARDQASTAGALLRAPVTTIRGGESPYGCVPFYKHFRQPGEILLSRRCAWCAATLFYPIASVFQKCPVGGEKAAIEPRASQVPIDKTCRPVC